MPGADSAIAVLDASVAVKWIVTEDASKEALELFDRPVTWLAPRLLLVEAASALRRKVAQKELSRHAASTDFTALLNAVHLGVILLAEDEEIVAAALSLALMLDHRVPDCLYLALAEREGAALATADARLAGLARSRNTAVLGVGAAAG